MRTAKLLLTFLVIGILFLLFSNTSYAAPSPFLNYQGRLENSNGDLLTGNYYTAFCIYNSTTATSCTPGSTPTVGAMTTAGTTSGTLNGALWGEVQYFSNTNSPSNEVENGVFNAQLGIYSSLTGSIFENGSSFYIGINVYNGTSWDGQMTPLQPINQVAYSMDSALLAGFGAAQSTGNNQVVVTNSSGDITLSSTNPELNVTGANTLTLNGGGGTGNIQFFNSSNYITSTGLAQFNGGINTPGSSSSYIGVGTAGSGVTQGQIRFVSNGPSGTDGAYIEYFPPVSGTNIASEVHISGSNAGSLSDLQLVTNTLNISNSPGGNTISINGTNGNITTAGNLTVQGTLSNTISGNTTLNNNLIVNGSTTTSGITNNGVLTNNGNGTFSGTLAVGGGTLNLNNSSSNLIESNTDITLNPQNTNTGNLNINATTSLPTATYDATSVVYNGYVYEIGGYTTAITAVVDYAPINSSGTIGTWTATTFLPTATQNATSVVYNGYVYEIGGYSGTANFSTVDYAPINSNGTLGSWIATTSLPTAIRDATSVLYNGYVYEIGGYTTAAVATVDYAPINSNGTLGSWIATTSLPNATWGATSVLYNGYVYEIGSGGVSASVVYAPINSNGTLGSWNTTTSLPTATGSTTSVVYNGYVYEIGGNNGSAVISTVDYASINSNGTLGSWTQTTSLPTATAYATSVIYNGYVYEIGGYTTAATATVDYFSVVSGNINVTNSISNTNEVSINGFTGNITTQGALSVLNTNNSTNTISGNTLISSGDLNISGLQTPQNLAGTVSTSNGQLNGGTYYYEVIAKNNTPGSSLTSFPSEYISISVPTGSSNEVSLTWNTVFNATSYDIFRSTNSQFSNALKFISNTNSFTDSNVSQTTSLPTVTYGATSVVYNGYV